MLRARWASLRAPDLPWAPVSKAGPTQLGQPSLQGQSTMSSSLIALIEASPLFENVEFRSPVVQVAGTDADRFHLSADVVRSGKQ